MTAQTVAVKPLTIDIDETRKRILTEFKTVKNFLFSSEITRNREAMLRRIMSHDYGYIADPDSKYQELLRFMDSKTLLVQQTEK